MATNVGEFWSFLLGFLALIHLFLCLLGKRDVDKFVYMLICVSKCQIMKIIFFFHSLFCALRHLQTDNTYTLQSPLYRAEYKVGEEVIENLGDGKSTLFGHAKKLY